MSNNLPAASALIDALAGLRRAEAAINSALALIGTASQSAGVVAIRRGEDEPTDGGGTRYDADRERRYDADRERR